jgi:hypothetical protein
VTGSNLTITTGGNVSGSSISTGSFGRVEAIRLSGDGADITGLSSFAGAAGTEALISGSSTSTGSFGHGYYAGYVGIGTATPDSLLHVSSTATQPIMQVESTGANSYPSMRIVNDARTWQMYVDGTDGDKFKIFDVGANAPRMTIDSSGNVSIGATSAAKLYFYDANASPSAQYIYSDGDHLFFESGGSIVSGAPTDIGGILKPSSNNVYTNGTSGLVWSTVYRTNESTGSDRNIKKNIVDIDAGLVFINTLKPRQFNFKASHGDDSQLRYGMIAQEVKEALDGAGVDNFCGYHEEDKLDEENNPTGETYYGLDYSQFISPLIKAVQELSAKVEALENE